MSLGRNVLAPVVVHVSGELLFPQVQCRIGLLTSIDLRIGHQERRLRGSSPCGTTSTIEQRQPHLMASRCQPSFTSTEIVQNWLARLEPESLRRALGGDSGSELNQSSVLKQDTNSKDQCVVALDLKTNVPCPDELNT